MAPQATPSPALGCHNVLSWRARACLRDASPQPHKRRAPGLDPVTAPQDTEQLDETRRERPARRRAQPEVAPPVARVWLEHEAGKTRPRGHPGLADTRVQRAVVMRLAALGAPALQAFSHGVRTGHRQHQALHERREPCRTLHSTWSVEADGRGGCDTLAWSHLRALRQQRVHEGGIVRRIGPWLPAGVLEAGARSAPDKGTPHGGGVSPLVANGFLQEVLDAWVGKGGPPRRQGRCCVTRCAEDVLRGCAGEADAHRVMDGRPKRVQRFGLPMHPAKTGVRAVQWPPHRAPSVRGKGTCACLGLPPSWATTRRGDGVLKRQTVGTRRRRGMQGRWTGGREHRHAPRQAQSRAVCATLRGPDPYDGLRGNGTRRAAVVEETARAWHSWLSRRRHTGHLHWQQCVDSVQRPRLLPHPRSIPHLSPRRGQQRDAPHGVSPVWCAMRRSVGAPEEPEEGNLHVWICGEGAGEPVPFPGT